MRAFFGRLIVCSTLLAGFPAVQAVEPAAPIVVAVEDQSTDAREVALRNALDRAVARLSGAGVAGNFWIAPQSVLTSYQYRRASDPASAAGLELLVQFDNQALARALRNAGHAVWEGPRPEVLAWIHGPEGWLDAVQTARDFPQLVATAQSWGYRLRFPQLDAAERGSVFPDDVQRGLNSRWLEASSAYALPWTLMILLNPAPAAPAAAADEQAAAPPPLWDSQWVLADERQALQQFALPPSSLKQAADAAWGRMTGLILEGESLRTASAGERAWTLELTDLRSADDYLSIRRRFLDMGLRCSLRSARPGSLSLQVEWRGDARALRRQAAAWGWRELPPEQAEPVNDMGDGGLQSFGLSAPEPDVYRFSVAG